MFIVNASTFPNYLKQAFIALTTEPAEGPTRLIEKTDEQFQRKRPLRAGLGLASTSPQAHRADFQACTIRGDTPQRNIAALTGRAGTHRLALEGVGTIMRQIASRQIARFCPGVIPVHLAEYVRRALFCTYRGRTRHPRRCARGSIVHGIRLGFRLHDRRTNPALVGHSARRFGFQASQSRSLRRGPSRDHSSPRALGPP